MKYVVLIVIDERLYGHTTTGKVGELVNEWVIDLETASLPSEKISSDRIARVKTDLCAAGADATNEEYTRCIDKYLSTHPATGQITCIGALDLATGQGTAYVCCDQPLTPKFGLEEGGLPFNLLYGTEAEAIEWLFGRNLERVITFNGRTFDLPFLTVRAIANGIVHTRSLDVYRYEYKWHVDLAEVFTHRGSQKMLGLEDYCLAMGIASSKQGRVSKETAGKHWEEMRALAGGNAKGKIKAESMGEELGRYCFSDVVATMLLYLKVRESLGGVVSGL